MNCDRINNRERELWIANDEGLYNWQRRSRKSMRAFIRDNREEIDAVIRRRLAVAPSAPRGW